MPRKMPTRDFVINQLRFLASWKKTPPTTRLRCLDRLAVIEKIYEVQMRDQEGQSGAQATEAVAAGTENAVNAMLAAALNMGRRDADKLSKGGSSGS